jgi:predicted MFS family arabinose efflux permease
MGSRWGWESVTVWSMFGFALLAFAFWVLVDLRSPHAVIDLRLMQRRSVWVANLVAFLLGAGMFGVLGFLPLLLQTPPDAGYGFDASVITVGLLLMAMPLAQAASSFASGRLGARLPLREQLALGSLLMALASAAFGLAHGSYWQIVPASTPRRCGTG